MRWISDHGFDEGSFNDAIQGLVRNSPWWMISIALHGVALFVLWTIPFKITTTNPSVNLQARLLDEIADADQQEEEEPEPDVPEEEIQEQPIVNEDEDDHNETDNDSDFEETQGEDGMTDAPFSGPSTNPAIGLGGGAGGGRPLHVPTAI